MAEATHPTQQYYTLAEGKPLSRNDTSDQLRTGSGGGFVLLTSTQLIENLAHFSRERIPERTVHAKAAGAWGYYEVTDDISDLTDAAFLNGIGNKTEVLTRISTVGPERGSADTVRDFRGYAIKFKTTQGNNDWVFNNQVSIVGLPQMALGHRLNSPSSLSSSFAIPSNSRP
jgi:catalase